MNTKKNNKRVIREDRIAVNVSRNMKERLQCMADERGYTLSTLIRVTLINLIEAENDR